MAREAIDVANKTKKDRVVTLSTGVRAILTPVASTLIQDVMSEVPDPPVPMWMNPEKEREEENPLDPEYIRAMREAEKKRSDAALDAVILFGVELPDGIPEDNRWLKNLQYLQKRGRIDLSAFDLEDEFEREFVYKRYVAVAGEDFNTIAELSGVPGSERARARNTFPGDEEWSPAGPTPAEGERSD